MALPTDPQQRKEVPIASAFLDYFSDAVAEVATLSFLANEQHNPGQPVAWDRDKSGDEADALMRHFMERGTIDTDGVRHSAKVAWRALALLQKELEAAYGLPLPRGARKTEVRSAREEFVEEGSEREIFQRETTRTEIPEEGYGNSLATEPRCSCDDCCNTRLKDGRYEKEVKASFPPFTKTIVTVSPDFHASVGTVAGVERGEVVGIPAERAESEGEPLASQVRSVERIKEAVFGTKQTPEV